jgi:hypothetical protein
VDFENTRKSGRNYPLPENLRVALIFKDEATTTVLQEKQALGKK